jgi:AmiR/NasT family two-component response regulator
MVAANPQTIRAVVVGEEELVAERLTAIGYDVVARVTAGREALDAARRLTPDAVLFATQLSDGLGVHAAQAVTRATPGVAALILSAHPAAANRQARPQWGAVSLMSADAAEDELDTDVREAIARARALVGVEAESAEAADVVENAGLLDLGAAVVDDIGEEVVDEPVDAREPVDAPESDEALIDRAIGAVAERTGLSTSDAFRLMEQEADDNGQTLREVALAMLSDS